MFAYLNYKKMNKTKQKYYDVTPKRVVSLRFENAEENEQGCKDPVSHRDAMKKASETWPKEKAKLLRRINREKKQKTAKVRTGKKPKAPDSDEKHPTEK